MNNNKNVIDEEAIRKIVNALSALDLNTLHKLAESSGISLPVNRLQNLVDITEDIIQPDKGKLVVYLVKSAAMGKEDG